MEATTDNRFEAVRERLRAFVQKVVQPAEAQFREQAAPQPWGRPPVLDALRYAARERGLYHVFSATRSAEFPFSTVQFAELAEITGHSPLLAQDAVGSLNPDGEVINLLHRFGTPEQQAQWLEPLRRGEIGCALCISEPDVASSDPTGLRSTAAEDGDAFVLDGHKSWSIGGLSPICELLVVVAATDPSAARPHDRFSLLLVPRQAPGVSIEGSASFFGYRNEARGGVAHIRFDQVRVPATSLLGPRGQGFPTVQTSLGPARLFHCMRLVGAAERALQLMCARLKARVVGGRPLAEDGLWQDRIAEARIRIEQARALTLTVARQVDAGGLRSASAGLSLAKAAVPPSLEWVMDCAIQAHGAAGMTGELPLADLWALARTLRYSDGPDEAHRKVVARNELRRQHEAPARS